MGGVNLCLLLPSSASMTSNSQARQYSFTSGARETCVGGRQYRAVPVPALCTRYTVHQTICDCSCNCPSQLEYNISACEDIWPLVATERQECANVMKVWPRGSF
jgi:hypothetical protein